jgi:hypothetical protein
MFRIVIFHTRFRVTIDEILDWIFGFITPYTFTQFGTTGNYSAIANLHALQFTITHALGFSVFSSRILATDLSQTHCNFKSHVKSSCHSLIPFFPLFCSCHLRRLYSTALDYFYYSYYKRPSLSLYNPSAWTPRKEPVLLRRRVYWSVT